jgi:hypothetical protein
VVRGNGCDLIGGLIHLLATFALCLNARHELLAFRAHARFCEDGLSRRVGHLIIPQGHRACAKAEGERLDVAPVQTPDQPQGKHRH